MAGRLSLERALKQGFFLTIGACLLIGLYARFAGLGHWPLAVDEYYLGQSTLNLLQHWLPEFDCGGFYTRGLIIQYTSALLVGIGMPLELALRLVCVVSNLIALPAVYLLARRVLRTPWALAVTALFLVSIWEVELARYGRMYAPFQALFVWYAYFLHRYLVDGKASALAWMYGLSAIGPLFWEGAIFLGVLNFLPIWWRQQRPKLAELAISSALLAFIYLIVNTNPRYSDIAELVPADFPVKEYAPPTLAVPRIAALGLLDHPLWSVALAVIIGLAIWRALRIAPRPMPWQYHVTWLAMIVALCFGLYALAVVAFLALGLRAFNGFSTDARQLRELLVLGAVSLAFWLGFLLLATGDTWWPGLAASTQIRRAVKLLVSFPNLLDNFLYLWIRAMPILTGLAGLCLAGLTFTLIRRPSTERPDTRLLAIVLLAMLAAVGAVQTNFFFETRYTFFCFPLVLILMLAALASLSEWLETRFLPEHRRLAFLAPLLVLWALLLGSDDVNVRRLVTIDSYDNNFRVGLPTRLVSHYYARKDYRSAADYVAAHAAADDEIVITEAPLGYYLPRVSYIYQDWSDPRFLGISCAKGTKERWTTLPMLYELDQVTASMAHSPATWLIVANDRTWVPWQQKLLDATQAELEFVTRDSSFAVYRIVAKS